MLVQIYNALNHQRYIKVLEQSGGEALNHELTLLQTDLIFLGGLVENAITKSLNSLSSRNLDESQEVIKNDDQIDHKRYQMEDHCMKIIREFGGQVNLPQKIDLLQICQNYFFSLLKALMQ